MKIELTEPTRHKNIDELIDELEVDDVIVVEQLETDYRGIFMLMDLKNAVVFIDTNGEVCLIEQETVVSHEYNFEDCVFHKKSKHQ